MNKFSKGVAITMSASMLLSNGSVFADTVKLNDETTHNFEGNCGKITFNDGKKHKVYLKNVKIDGSNGNSAIDVSNNTEVTIVLEGSNNLNGAKNHPAIWVESGSSLTIDGNGSLEARAGGTTIGKGAAGIGSGYGTNTSFGDITIKNGTIVAWGSEGGAGIGGGYEVGGGTATGNITIEGGCVKAYSERKGAGIGAGQNASYGGTVTISGGVIYASGVVSVGAGSKLIGTSSYGKFSTGANGNAVIIAPNKIGSVYKDCDAILLKGNVDENSAKLVGDTIVFDDKDANIQVYGNPKLDKNIRVNKGTVLNIIKGKNSGNSSTLTMASDKILTNDGEIVVGLSNEDKSSLVLKGGKEKTAGKGNLIVSSNGKVVVPVTKSMINLSNADNLVFDGKEKNPTVSVNLELWGYHKTYEENIDYNLSYLDNKNASSTNNHPKAVVNAKNNGCLLIGSSYGKDFHIGQANFDPGIPNTWSVKNGEDKLLEKLPQPINHTTPKGNLKWYSDEERKTPLTDDFVQGEGKGDVVRIYGKYEHNDSNYNPVAEGYLDLKIVEYPIPEMKIEADGMENRIINKTYGDSDIIIKTTAHKDNVEISNPNIEYSTSNKDVANVVEENGEHKIKINGAGTAIITIKLKGNDAQKYSGMQTDIKVNVDPKEVRVNEKSIKVEERKYNSKKEIDTDKVKASLENGDIINNDSVNLKITKAYMDDENVGQNKVVHLEYRLEDISGGNKNSNYILSNKPEGLVTITKLTDGKAGEGLIPAEISKEQIIYNKKQETYEFNLESIVPKEEIGGLTDIVVESSSVDKKYFKKEDLKVSENKLNLSIPVKKVNVDKVGSIGEIKVKIIGNNFDTTGKILLTAKNNPKDTSEVGIISSGDSSTGGINDGGSSTSETISSGTSSLEKDIIGKDRYETAGLIADRVKYYNSIILVNANEALADGLSAAALSGKEDAPILLVKKDSIPKATMDRIKNVSKVYIIGGENAISKKVEEQLKGKTIERIGGKDRIETSMLIAKKLGNYSKVFLVNGYTGEADAMSASAAAAKYEAPIILTNGKKSELDKKSNVDYYAIGGESVLEDSLVDKYDAERLGGKDRYETNRLVIKELYKNSSKYYYTKGNPLVDALTISLRAKDSGVVLVSPKSDNSILKGKDIVQVGGMDFKIEPIK